MNTTLIVLAKDASNFDAIRMFLSAHGVIENTVEGRPIVIPKNVANMLTFQEQIKPYVMAMRSIQAGSTYSLMILEVELKQSPTT